ncbi:DUF433 domain-containing protein [Sphingomonas sp. MMS24-JH45]
MRACSAESRSSSCASVELVLDFFVRGWSVDDIVREYPSITIHDVRAIFALAAELVKEERFIIESKVA